MTAPAKSTGDSKEIYGQFGSLRSAQKTVEKSFQVEYAFLINIIIFFNQFNTETRP